MQNGLSPAIQKFILHWGEMGLRWGVSRSMAQVHALLYISDRPLPAEDIASTLNLTPLEVNAAISELQAWGLAQVARRDEDCCDQFVALSDAWEMLQVILAERRRRELDPAISLLRECLADVDRGSAAERISAARLRSLLSFLEEAVQFYEQVRTLPKGTLLKAMRLGRHLARIVERATGGFG
ncbi:GbsR/MarR family transcriptional regulator [Myxococcota bacterium]